MVHRLRTPAPRWEASRAYWNSAYLKRLGFRPQTVIDIGVGKGTPELYRAFPDAFLVLVEPLQEFAAAARRVLARRAGVLAQVALGRVKESRTIYIQSRWTERSSLYARTAVERNEDCARSRTVPVTTLDGLDDEHGFAAPIGLKIDAEGGELDIICGAAGVLRKTDFVIAEVNVMKRFEGSYTFAEFIAAMDGAGFGVADVLDIGRLQTSEVMYLDLVFVRNTASSRFCVRESS